MSLLPWHDELAARLRALVEAEQLPHAVLITGPDGWGELALTEWLASTLLSLSPAARVSELAHADLHWIRPDGAEIKVDDVRELGEFAFSTSRQGGRKVAVVEDAHLLNRSAANALLKTLEEPPEDTYLLLASCQAGRLLPTIRSRCQRFVIRPQLRRARDWLGQRSGDETLAERLIAHAGSPISVAAELSSDMPPLAAILVRALVSERPRDAVSQLIERDAGLVTGGWYRLLRDEIATPGRFPPLAGTSRTKLFGFVDELLWVRHQLVNTNSANAQLLLERLAVRWRALAKSAAVTPQR